MRMSDEEDVRRGGCPTRRMSDKEDVRRGRWSRGSRKMESWEVVNVPAVSM